jgi:CRAL/TRIO domain/CRAL/TRIO, N-terminal domain
MHTPDSESCRTHPNSDSFLSALFSFQFKDPHLGHNYYLSVRMQPPFDPDVHILSPPPRTDDQCMKFKQLKQNLFEHHSDLSREFESWLTDQQLVRFLIARNYDVTKTTDLLIEAMKWRRFRKPHLIESMEAIGSTKEHWSIKFEKECATGKIYNPGFDQYNRPFVIFENEAQNTNNVDDQMLFLAWSLEFAIRQMPTTVDKYCIFIHMQRFSIFRCPPLSSTKETLQMLGKLLLTY